MSNVMREMTAAGAQDARGEFSGNLKRTTTFTHNGQAYEVRATQLDDRWCVAAYRDGVRVSNLYEVVGQFADGTDDAILADYMIAAENDVHGL